MVLEKIDNFELSEMFRMVRVLSFEQDNPENKEHLLKKLLSILRDNVNQLNSDQIVKIVNISIRNYLEVDVSFFDENLIKTSIQHFINNKVNIVDTGRLLKALAKIVSVIFIQPLQHHLYFY